MNKIKKTVEFTLSNPLEACLGACYYIVTCAVGIWALMFACNFAKAIVLG